VDAGFKVRELVAGSNLFDVILPSGMIKEANKANLKEKLALLAPIKKNTMWLSLGGNQISDEDLKALEGFENLQLLKLERNPITDSGVDALTNLKGLTALNLFGTKVTSVSLTKFTEFPKLKKVYLWNTAVTKEEVAVFKANT